MSLWKPSSWFGRFTSSSVSATATTSANEQPPIPTPIRIGIVGGGIAGVSVAHALCQLEIQNQPKLQRLQYQHQQQQQPLLDIVVLDSEHDIDNLDKSKFPVPPQELWEAATAKNGNSLVPGASFYILSRPSAVKQVLVDTVRRWYHFKRVLPTAFSPRQEDFNVVPPYFSLHLTKCLGPSATADERWSFVRFCQQYLYFTLWKSQQAGDERAQQLYQLAKANRAIYLKELEKSGEALRLQVGHSKGFLALHRDLNEAKASVEQVRQFGEEAYLMDWQQAVERVPRLANFPMQPLYVVSRPNDYAANCDAFVRHLVHQTRNKGVRYRPVRVQKVVCKKEDSPSSQPLSSNGAFVVTTSDGATHEFDLLVLAAGVHTPLLAAQLDAGQFCPTYPLRGFSLTLFAWQQQQEQQKHQQKQQPKKSQNLIMHPFKLDAMYCSSISPWMTRWVGFGDFCGYRATAAHAPSLAPDVLARYAKVLFPDPNYSRYIQSAVPCFRAMSPDDLPLVGEVAAVPGLFLHTGHGSLGWTTGLATGECLAQAIQQKINNNDKVQGGTFTLSDGTVVDQPVLSPNRFVH